ncbi:HAMP domain-containing sensor histidine kinase [Stappia sp.]|uniref:sensor histidine kinase n=1 Tax=Stappia sp. TaxID=1870903 RepID=UPI0032D8CBCB
MSETGSGSLGRRLTLAGAVAVLAALGLAAAGLIVLFGAHVERRATAELSVHLDQVMAGLARRDGGLAVVRAPADPRFARPYGGLYWQIETGDTVLRSRSLWDVDLALPVDELEDGRVHVHRLAGPDGQALLVLERSVRLPAALGNAPARVAVALDRAELDAARRAFATDLMPYLALLAGVLIAAQIAQVRFGLGPLRRIGARVATLRDGRATRMGADWPREVRPLAREIDALMAAREADVDRARLRAGDLAHGLKTPLQALLGEAGRLRARGAAREAEAIEEVVRTMQGHVERELVRARTIAGGRSATQVLGVAERIVSVLRRTPDGERLTWEIAIPKDLAVALDPADLAEAIGALAENAARHARSHVALTAARADAMVRIHLRDDGPGVPETEIASLVTRGRRLDERGTAMEGTGLGLSIASEIAEAVGGGVSLANRPEGFEAVLELPGRTAPPSPDGN